MHYTHTHHISRSRHCVKSFLITIIIAQIKLVHPFMRWIGYWINHQFLSRQQQWGYWTSDVSAGWSFQRLFVGTEVAHMPAKAERKSHCFGRWLTLHYGFHDLMTTSCLNRLYAWCLRLHGQAPKVFC